MHSLPAVITRRRRPVDIMTMNMQLPVTLTANVTATAHPVTLTAQLLVVMTATMTSLVPVKHLLHPAAAHVHLKLELKDITHITLLNVIMHTARKELTKHRLRRRARQVAIVETARL